MALSKIALILVCVFGIIFIALMGCMLALACDFYYHFIGKHKKQVKKKSVNQSSDLK